MRVSQAVKWRERRQAIFPNEFVEGRVNATLSSSTPTLQLSFDMDNTVQDLSHLQWRAPEYLLSLPSGQLSSSEFAMDYFTMSPFFDKHSNNNQLRMQLMFSRGGIQGVNEQEELK